MLELNWQELCRSSKVVVDGFHFQNISLEKEPLFVVDGTLILNNSRIEDVKGSLKTFNVEAAKESNVELVKTSYGDNPNIVQFQSGTESSLSIFQNDLQKEDNLRTRFVSSLGVVTNSRRLTDRHLRNQFSADAVGIMVMPKEIRNHRSGQFLPPIIVHVVNALNQAVPGNEMTVDISLREGDSSTLRGQKTTHLSDGVGEFSEIMLSALPGSHDLVIDSIFGAQYVTVIVDDCTVHETRQDLICIPCISGNCASCPHHAVCGVNTVIPQSGYWSRHCNSTDIIKCVGPHACQRNALALFPSGLGNSSGDEEGERNCCRTGYEGVLCGSCASNYGHVVGHECEECRNVKSGILLGLMIVFTFFITWILIKTSWIPDQDSNDVSEAVSVVQEIEMVQPTVCEIEVDAEPVVQHFEPRNSFGIKEITADAQQNNKRALEVTSKLANKASANLRMNALTPGAQSGQQLLAQISDLPLATTESMQDSEISAKPFISESLKVTIKDFGDWRIVFCRSSSHFFRFPV